MNEFLDFNWIRQIRVELSGLVDKRLPSIGTFGVGGHYTKTLEGDGSADKLRISARIAKFLGEGDPAQIQIWNLSPDTISGLHRGRTRITVSAKWRDGPRSKDWMVVFTGEYQAAQTTRSGPDTVTTIYALSGLEDLVTATVSKTFQNESVRDVVLYLARRFRRVGVDEKSVVGIEGTIGSFGWSTCGLVSDALNSLAEEHGFDWCVDDNHFRATGARATAGHVTTVNSSDLVYMHPVFETPFQVQVGVAFECILNPAIRPHEDVNIVAGMKENQGLSGTYKVHFVEHGLDTHADHSFVTHGKAFTVPKDD